MTKSIELSRQNAQTTTYVSRTTHRYISSYLSTNALTTSHSFLQVLFNMTALSSSQPSLPSLPSRLSTIHQRLLESGLYLGDRSVREKVAWAQDGKSHKLVIKSSIPSAEALAMDNDSDSDGSPNSALVPEPATLSAVVLLSDQDFWMVADAGYRGPGKFNREFADVKPSCSGGIPDVDPFKSDFAEVTANVHWLMDSIATRGFKQKKGFVTGPADAPRLKVRHILFEVRTCVTTDSYLTDIFLQQNGEVFLTNGNDKEAQVDDGQ